MKIVTESCSYGDHPHQQLTVYRRDDKKTRPGLLVIHGGYWATRASMGNWPKKFAEDGYVVIEPQYRLNSEARWPAPHLDVHVALNTARQHAAKWSLDPQRIAAFGSSSGGHLAAMLGVTHTGLKGIAALSPPLSPYRSWLDGDDPVGLWREKRMRLREEAQKLAGCAPIKKTPGWDTWVDMTTYQHVTGEEPPMWLGHFQDDLVPASHSLDLSRHLVAAENEPGNAVIQIVSGAGHGMTLMNVPRVQKSVKMFLATAAELSGEG